MPSAGDVERFGYCAHNWWLAKQGVEGGHGEGVVEHDRKGEAQLVVEHTKREAKEWLRWSFRILAVTASVTFLGLELAYLRQHPQHWAFLLTALVMLSMSSGLLTIAAFNERKASTHLRDAGLVPGQLLASDLAGEAELLEDPAWDLSGRPDYVLKTQKGTIPVEVKTGKTPATPFDSHVLQLACYLRLIEASTGQPPPYGLVTYPEGTFRVEWDDDVKAYLKGTLERMAEAEAAGKADRDHEHAGRCKGCARREGCDQRIA